MNKKQFDYLSAAQKMFDKGDFKSALHYAFLQRDIEQNEEVYAFIADTYVEMGLYDEAFSCYLKAYDFKPKDPRIFDGILECLRDEDGAAAAFYMQEQMSGDQNVLEMFSELSECIEDSDLDGLFADSPPQEPNRYDWRDQSTLMDEAIFCAHTGNHEEAERLFDSIGKDSFQYESAAYASASLKLSRDDADGAIAILDDIIARGSESVDVHITKVIAHDFKGDRDGVEAAIKILDTLQEKGVDDTIKVALCLCSYGHFAEAEKHVNKALQYCPYDKVLLLCMGDVRLHQGKYDEALEIMNEICAVFPEDIEAHELARRLKENRVPSLMREKLEIGNEWGEKLSHILLEGGDLTTDEAKKLIKWAYKCSINQALQAALGVAISKLPELDALTKELLVDPFISSDVKKPILRRKILGGKDKQIKLVTQNALKTIEVNPPDSPNSLRAAYCEVLTYLAIEELFFEKDFAIAVDKISTVMRSSDEAASLAKQVVAAVLYEISTTIVDKDDACTRFGCTSEEFLHARAILHISDDDKPTKGHAISKRR